MCVFFQFIVYFTSKVSESKALHIMCKRDTESVKVAPERVLSNRGLSRRYALDRGGFSPGEVFTGGLSPYTRTTNTEEEEDINMDSEVLYTSDM